MQTKWATKTQQPGAEHEITITTHNCICIDFLSGDKYRRRPPLATQAQNLDESNIPLHTFQQPDVWLTFKVCKTRSIFFTSILTAPFPENCGCQSQALGGSLGERWSSSETQYFTYCKCDMNIIYYNRQKSLGFGVKRGSSQATGRDVCIRTLV